MESALPLGADIALTSYDEITETLSELRRAPLFYPQRRAWRIDLGQGSAECDRKLELPVGVEISPNV